VSNNNNKERREARRLAAKVRQEKYESLSLDDRYRLAYAANPNSKQTQKLAAQLAAQNKETTS
jgi:hypothetical protein